MRNPFGSRHDRAAKRLTKIRQQLAELDRELHVLGEQVVHATQVEGDARMDAVVAGHEIAAREHRAANRDLESARRERDAVRAKREKLVAEQDALLERMLD